ncbi:hypothetical protein ACHAXN_011253 [Cyclotella atomus]
MIRCTSHVLAFAPHLNLVYRCQPRQFHFTSACRWSHNSNDAGSPASSDTLPSFKQSAPDDGREQRKAALHSRLQQLGVDVDALSDAAFRSAATTDGFDKRFGKSAIKAYRTYIDPRPSKITVISREDVNVGANRIARQIDFLAKKHRSREADWVRHTDEPKDSQTFPLILVLDNLRSAANVGSIYRSADACGCLEILTAGITPHPNGNGEEKLSKSALGAERVVPSKHFETTLQALTYLREERPRFLLVGMETTERSKCYANVKYPRDSEKAGVALFLGNEVSGVDTDIMLLLDEVVEIPMFGKKNSLNVAACAPVVMYEVLRQWEAFP